MSLGPALSAVLATLQVGTYVGEFNLRNTSDGNIFSRPKGKKERERKKEYPSRIPYQSGCVWGQFKHITVCTAHCIAGFRRSFQPTEASG